VADRYIIDILDGEIEDKYLAFPQRGEKLPWQAILITPQLTKTFL
jgi:hypothetical protein